MADLDAQFLATAALSPAGAAKILKRSRQTVSRGVSEKSRQYFRDSDYATLYQAILVQTPVLAPSVLGFLQAHRSELAARLKAPTGPAVGLAERLASRQPITEVWISLPSFQSVIGGVWGWISPLLERNDIVVDVFIETHADFDYFLAAARRHACRASKPLSLDNVRLWQPNPLVALAQQLIIVEPHAPGQTAAYIWDGVSFHPKALERSQDVCTAFINQIVAPNRNVCEIMTLGDPDRSEAMDEEAAEELVASVREAGAI